MATEHATATAAQQSRASWTENAHDWLQRSRRKRALAQVPTDPSSAAWAFVRPSSSAGGSNLAFLDTALRRQTATDQLPVIDVRGDCCKTWTVVTLASRFAVATRPSQFESTVQTTTTTTTTTTIDNDPPASLPQVIVLDSTHDVTTAKLAYTVRSNLLRQSGSSSPADFQRDTESCLARIHLATADDVSGWVSLLEALRSKLAPVSSEYPTLVLWDGFLSEPHDEAGRMEVIRQLARLVQECSVLLVTTTNRMQHDWDKFVTHRIKLDRNHAAVVSGAVGPNGQQHEYMATVHGSRIPFSVSLAGILS
jgi:hypothetical protein